ncbi:hypothetical protein BO71DRAFT_480378 [Aspergillus ellipticus CBS 707.79]|uniref:Putative zinc-finger domain-containing protein n=1 Tax=Aspergillus ellipticus CBS 707.79 TaxID=1448320 RepID=A0A319DWC5_9EURO|nr:hypothetical protein BO71DRAFT_480378 [Aspergillus ellipticus CBS 707.79]
MSNYPPTPSFVGPNYNPQWHPSHPSPSTSMPSLLPPNFPFNQNPSPMPQPPPDGATRPFDYTNEAFIANSHLPGLGGPGATGPLPPPPFPFPFASTQFPPPPPFPMQMPPLRYPSIPIPSAPVYEPARPSTTDYQPQADHSVPNRGEPQLAAASASDLDPDREEGELTDLDAPSSSHPTQDDSSSRRQPTHVPCPPKGLGKNRNRISNGNSPAMNSNSTGCDGSNSSHMAISEGSGQDGSELGKGETSSVARLSSRSSGSPYNPAPPIPADIVSHENSTLSNPQHQIVPESGSNSTSPGDPQSPSGGRSPAQLRVQAQGALLGLAPHNVRYGELVREGINPTILRQLYEEVGIKIASPQPEVPLASLPGDNSYGSERSTMDKSLDPEQGREPIDISSAKGIVSHQPSAETATTTTSSEAKPMERMERKDMIARMLAAKAAKKSGESAPPLPEVAKETPLSGSLAHPDAGDKIVATPSPEQPTKDVRVKEKNKAQTELARQRIEQLKKQGLMRNGLKPQAESAPPDQSQPSSNSGQDMLSTPTPAPIQHPLPERPPDPETISPSRIPGLFMTDQEPTAMPTDTPATRGSTETTPQPRINQRKRPRASDFDEPVPIPKKNFNNGVSHVPETQRLVIDISDDEFYGDDENESMDIDTPAGKELQDAEGFLGAFSAADLLLQRPKTASSQGVSTSGTPQSSRNNDQEHQEHLRKKDLEIKAMHRRIAELEERKKAKLAASRTQSPRMSDVPGPSMLTNPITVEDASDASIASTDPELGAASPRAADIRLSTPADPTQIEKMKLKLLRKQEIEAGIPALDAEIQRSEEKLAQVNYEQDKLTLEITKGKEGRRQLLAELKLLNFELNGLTFDDVEIALRRFEAKEQFNEQEDSGVQEITEDSEMLPENSQSELPALEDTDSVQESILPETVPQPNTAGQSTAVSDDKMMDDVSVSPDEPSTDSDSTGSAMDESSDSSSEGSVDEEDLQLQTTVPETSAPRSPEEPIEDEQAKVDESRTDDLQHPLPERPQPVDVESRDDVVSDEQVTDANEQASRESSVSDGYEPPEPEAASPADSTYSPPFSPASPGPIDPPEIPDLSTDEAKQAEQPLTRNVQDLETQQQPRPIASAQVGILDNTRRPEDSKHKFSPYSSPLKYFKAYRYHPNFTDNVSDGYRSLTYSHNIDPMKYLCPFEATGGVCNDRSCEFQHFRDMTLSGSLTATDDKILVQMGSLREGKTPVEKDEYIAGLKQIINDMRRDKVKDFSTVATEIAAYRRRFLQDPSRVLPL